MTLDFQSHYAMMKKPTSIVGMLEGSYQSPYRMRIKVMAKSKRTEIPREVKKCSVNGCDQKHEGKGFCKRHREQVKRYGVVFQERQGFTGTHSPNRIIIDDTIAYIILDDLRGYTKAQAIIDTNDLPLVAQLKWHISEASPLGPVYVKTRINGKGIYLHNFLLNDKGIDHQDKNGLNNRRTNLRKASKSQNACNSTRRRASRTGYRGVYQLWCRGKLANRYKAEIRFNGKNIHIGSFKSPELAAKARDEVAINLQGEFCTLNFPQP